MTAALTPEDFAAKREALAAWTADRSRLVFLHPLVASLALQLDIVAVVDERLPTAATDGRSVFINAHWLKGMEPEKRLFVLAHAVWHNALLHLRRGQGREHGRWNLAIDHEVNGLLVRDGFRMPSDAVHYEEWKDLAAEEVYERLENPLERLAVGLDEDGLPDRPVEADVHLGQDEVHQEPSAGEATGFDAVFGPITGKRDPDYPAHAEPLVAEEWAERMVALEGQLAGLLPSGLRLAVKTVTQPTLRWQVLLREFLERTTGGGSRWIPPSRRHVHRGLYLPSRQAEQLRIAVALDTSGSTQHDLPRFLAELQRMVRAFGRYEVRLLQCDAAVASDERYDEARPLPSDVELFGGGGTDFRPVFERLASEPPQALVFFTDGHGYAPAHPPPWPVLWVLTPDGEQHAPWGKVIQMDAGHGPRSAFRAPG